MAADNIALAIAEIGSLSERRIALMMDSHMSQLPPFLVKTAASTWLYDRAQVTAAALASENKALYASATAWKSRRPQPTRRTTFSWRRPPSVRLWAMAENTRVLAVEWLLRTGWICAKA